MVSLKQILFATSNKEKLREFREILKTNVVQIELELLEPQAIDVDEVAREKAMQAYRALRKPVLVEDTGLFIHAWNGFPGALVKLVIKSAGLNGLLGMLGAQKDRYATAKTAIAFYDGKKVHVFSGSIDGVISNEARGASGFGWDPIFIPKGYEKSFAELSGDSKNRISMRSIALLKLKEYMQEHDAD